mmetsp:Transcript_108047/g.312217  ORF Transcript_108047/g.312217 Transcript_108047/m.312217 type:complete len:218 (+) Transcript_108047:1587-2240(+)
MLSPTMNRFMRMPVSVINKCASTFLSLAHEIVTGKSCGTADLIASLQFVETRWKSSTLMEEEMLSPNIGFPKKASTETECVQKRKLSSKRKTRSQSLSAIARIPDANADSTNNCDSCARKRRSWTNSFRARRSDLSKHRIQLVTASARATATPAHEKPQICTAGAQAAARLPPPALLLPQMSKQQLPPPPLPAPVAHIARTGGASSCKSAIWPHYRR